jgi:hypothetical protein
MDCLEEFKFHFCRNDYISNFIYYAVEFWVTQTIFPENQELTQKKN